MTLYLIPGLGADERVFKDFDLDLKTQVIHWIEPTPKESLADYADRLSAQIDTSQPFGILGVSFGGMIAVEMAKLLNPKITILVSSVSCSDQLPQHYVKLGKTGALNLLPDALLKPPVAIMSFLFGAENNELLRAIIRDTDPSFLRWALNAILSWGSSDAIPSCIRIHGTKDRVIPLKGDATQVEGGGHFMIVNRAVEVSRIVNEVVARGQASFRSQHGSR